MARSELGELMWVAWVARPGAIYDDSAASQTFQKGTTVDIPGIPEIEETKIRKAESQMILSTYRVSLSSTRQET